MALCLNNNFTGNSSVRVTSMAVQRRYTAAENESGNDHRKCLMVAFDGLSSILSPGSFTNGTATRGQMAIPAFVFTVV